MKRKHQRTGKSPKFRTFSPRPAKPQSHRFLIGALLVGIAVLMLVGLRPGSNSAGQATLGTSCHDSDGGLTYAQVGTVSGKRLDGMLFTGTDVCSGSATVLERYCNNGMPAVQPSRCLNGCSNGACR